MKTGWRCVGLGLAVFWAGACWGASIRIDHRHTDITQLTEAQINRAKSKLHIAYSHTSHGSQLTEGMTGLVDFANGGGRGLNLPRDIFAWNDGGSGGALDLHDYAMEGDVGYYPDWVRHTRAYLDDPAHADVNVVVWAWCGQMGEKYREGTLAREYLRPMADLERRYPHVVFVYMTGHVDIWDDADNKAACRAIRDWCASGNRVLYDFNDIERHNPDGTYFPYVHEDCGIYDGPAGTETGNWATSWQNTHTEGVDWYNCGSEHSQPLNANLKAYAAWALWCQIAESPVLTDSAVLSVTPSSRRVGGSSGTTTFRVENRGGEPLYYRASESVSWLRIASGGAGNNRGTFTVYCSANPSSRARTGTVTVAASGARGSPRRVKVVQAGRRKVDLVLRKLAVTRPSRAASRTFTSCRFQIYNRGPSLISGKIAVRFYLSRDRTMGNSDDRRIGDARFVGISIRSRTKKHIVMGSSRLAQMVRFWTAGRVPRGYYYVYAKVSCTTATETRPGDNLVRTASRFPYSSAAARSAHRIEAASPAAWARSGEGDWAPAPELVDGDVDTVWTGAFPGPWAVALDFGDIIQLQDAEIQFAADPWPNVGMMGTDDRQHWFDLQSIPTWPVACRAVYFDFRDDGSGLAPAIQEIRREQEEGGPKSGN